MKSDEECLEEWYRKLHTEWLPHWQDMPDSAFAWWNLLVIALDDATD